MAVTRPATVLLSAAIETDAFCPTCIAARSLSTTSAVTWNVAASTAMASPAGASRPGSMLTAVTSPSIGATSVASLIWVRRSARVLVAFETCVWAL